mmetsp:Transcript_18970/g.27274  ORF Transcript_18970/g.27274 Transcript_18970/m.27274 type:complete len:88 (-) Transcript_18970:2193-2456(-)
MKIQPPIPINILRNYALPLLHHARQDTVLHLHLRTPPTCYYIQTTTCVPNKDNNTPGFPSKNWTRLERGNTITTHPSGPGTILEVWQ